MNPSLQGYLSGVLTTIETELMRAKLYFEDDNRQSSICLDACDFQAKWPICEMMAWVEEPIEDRTAESAPVYIGRLTKTQRTQMRAHRLSYIDFNGYLHLVANGVLIDSEIKPFKPLRQDYMLSEGELRALTLLLVRPEMFSWPNRKVKAETDLGIATLSRLYSKLRSRKLLNNQNLMIEPHGILTLWAQGFCERLQANLLIGNYQLPPKAMADWKSLPLETSDTHWGGDIAGNLLTGYLDAKKPEKIYTLLSPYELKAKYMIMPSAQGQVKIYHRFWPDDHGPAGPEIIAFADLKQTGDPRAIETANLIYEGQIKKSFKPVTKE